MTVGTLVIIVLAIIVLVVVALGFGTGWSNLWNKMKSYFGGGANVDDVKQACNYACTTKATYDYCKIERNVILADKTEIKTKTCENLAESYQSAGFVPCDIKCEDAKCQGTAVDCKDITPLNKENCEKQTGCIFTAAIAATSTTAATSAKCEGSTTAACESGTEEACKKIQGCSWI